MAVPGSSVSSVSTLHLLILPQRIQKRHFEAINRATKKRNIKTSLTFGPEITHIVTEFQTVDQALRSLKLEHGSIGNTPLVSLSWLTDCLKSGAVMEVTEKYRLCYEQQGGDKDDTSEEEEAAFPEWACQRVTPLVHCNQTLTNALEVLQLHAELRDQEQDYSRALAFRRASCVLKSLPFKLRDLSQLQNVKDIGNHVRKVVQEILEDGHSSEIDAINNSLWFKQMKEFTSVFGIGPSTAKKWIERGWSSLEDVVQSGTVFGDWRITWGLAFHRDLMTKVCQFEAGKFTAAVTEEVNSLLPGATVQLVGGFRRGKKEGHDVDVLISHPEEGREVGILPQLLRRLEKRGLILYGNHERNSFSDEVLMQDYKLSMRGQLDHFEKWLGICKFPQGFREHGTATNTSKQQPSSRSVDENDEPKTKLQKLTSSVLSPFELSAEDRDWLARRVDLIIVPNSQYYYALVGWTGNKHFNRDLRLYATKKLNMKLTSHGLYCMARGTPLPACSEEEVFHNLKLEYREPWERNC